MNKSSFPLVARIPKTICFPAVARWLGFSLGIALVLPLGALAQTPPPEAAPGQVVPKHAAGGWPSDTTGDDKKPERTAEQQANLDAVAAEMKRLANESGPDSVILQAKLLIRAMGAGANGATEVKVAGPSEVAGADYLEIRVETGIEFDGATTTPESRRAKVWKEIAMPVLDEMVSFKIDPSALELVFYYEARGGGPKDGNTADDDPSSHQTLTREGFRARIPKATLEKVVSNEIEGDALATVVELEPIASTPVLAAELH